MAGNDKDVKIGFVTTADTAGAEKTIDKVEEITSATRVAIGTEETYAEYLADNERRQAQYAENEKKRLAAETSAIEKKTEALQTQREEIRPWSEVNPMTDGSMWAAEERIAEAKRQTAAAEREKAEAVKETIAVEDEALQKQREADVERAKALKKTREDANQAAPELDRVIGLQRAQIALQVGQALGQMAVNVRALGVDLQAAGVKGATFVTGLATGMDSVSAALTGAATGFATGGPLGAAIGGAIGLMKGPLSNAINDTVEQYKQLKISQDNAATAAKGLKSAQEAASLEGKRNFLVEYFQRGKDAIQAATEAIERQRELTDSIIAADTSSRETAQRQAIRSGADPNAVGNQDIRGDFETEIAELNRKVLEAQQDAAAAKKAAEDAESRSNNTTLDQGFSDSEVEAAKAAYEEAAKLAEKSRLDAIALAERVQQETRILQDQLQEREVAAYKGFQDQQIEKSNEIVGLVESSKQKLSATQQQALDRTKEALADGQLSAQEQAQLTNDLRTILGGFRSTVAQNVEVAKLFTEVVTLQNTNVTDLKNIVSGLKAQVEDLRVQIKTITTPQSAR